VGYAVTFIEMAIEALQDGAANIFFGAIVLFSFALMILAAMFFLLAVRGCWRWMVGHTWGDVVASTARKALK
jgi:hypothetical protein